MAQDPFIHTENNTGVKVQRGGVTVITSANLSVVTNLDIRAPEDVFLPPEHGTLYFIDKDYEPVTEADAVSSFTLRDLEAGRLAYHHDGSQDLTDMFNVTARGQEGGAARGQHVGGREVLTDVGIVVRVFLESHQRAPHVVAKQPVVVEELSDVTVSRRHLEVNHGLFI